MKKYRVTKKYNIYESDGLKVGDIVTKVDGSVDDDLYELPKHLHGKGHTADVYNEHLNLKEPNYIYIQKSYLEEIKENKKVKKYNHYILMKQSTRPNDYDEWLVVEGTYQECLREMPRIQKGYIMASNEPDASIRYSSDDPTCKIVKTKGWD